MDVIGLYSNPPERAAVSGFDEKTQCQALDRSQPSLPVGPGHAGFMTHHYRRNGTTDFFAALHVATREVSPTVAAVARARACCRFFNLVDLHVPRQLDVHVVLDNLSAH